MLKKVIAYTGHKAKVSGIYRPSGGLTEYVFDEDETVPPNNEGKRQEFFLVRKAKHKKN